jgi:catalase
VALILSEEGCAGLLAESAAMDFVANAFVHLKAIGYTRAARPLLEKSGVSPDAGVIDLSAGAAEFLSPARTRQWAREPKVRMLA